MISFNVITPFPAMFNNILNESILLKAKQKKIAEYNIFNLFDFLDNPSERIDDYPFGGGPGMLMKSEPIVIVAGEPNSKFFAYLLHGIDAGLIDERAKELALLFSDNLNALSCIPICFLKNLYFFSLLTFLFSPEKTSKPFFLYFSSK